MTRLARFTLSPDTVPNPFPQLAERRSKRVDGYAMPDAWPTSALPGAVLAEALAADGYTFIQGSGYRRDGAHVEPDAVGRRVADYLDTTAARLAALPNGTRAQVTTALLGASRLAVCDAWDDVAPGDGPLFSDHLEAATRFTRSALAALRSRDATHDGPAEIVTCSDWRPWSAALTATASDLRTSVAARRRLLEIVRSHLPAPSSTLAPSASRFFARLDGYAMVRRADLVSLYSEAGAPGKLTARELREIATDRWGTPKLLNGAAVYRPAKVDRERPEAVLPLDDLTPPPYTPADPYAAARWAANHSDPVGASLAALAALDAEQATN